MYLRTKYIIPYFNLDFLFIDLLYSERDWEVVACFIFLPFVASSWVNDKS